MLPNFGTSTLQQEALPAWSQDLYSYTSAETHSNKERGTTTRQPDRPSEWSQNRHQILATWIGEGREAEKARSQTKEEGIL